MLDLASVKSALGRLPRLFPDLEITVVYPTPSVNPFLIPRIWGIKFVMLYSHQNRSPVLGSEILRWPNLAGSSLIRQNGRTSEGVESTPPPPKRGFC